MSIRDQARTAAALKVLSELVDRQRGTEKRLLADALQALGINGTVDATLPDGTPLGTVGMTKGRVTASVSDETALMEWVMDNHPSEIETVQRVRPAYVRKLLSASANAGVGTDPATGEAVPGVSVGRGEPYVTVRLADGAHEAVLSALGAGYQPLALPAGEQ